MSNSDTITITMSPPFAKALSDPGDPDHEEAVRSAAIKARIALVELERHKRYNLRRGGVVGRQVELVGHGAVTEHGCPDHLVDALLGFPALALAAERLLRGLPPHSNGLGVGLLHNLERALDGTGWQRFE